MSAPRESAAGNRPQPRVRRAQPADYPQLLRIWRDAVEQTHHFLTPADVDWYEGYVRDQLPQLPDLRVAVDADDGVRGFIAQSGGDIDMLFVDPAAHGQGVGTALLETVGAEFSLLRVDVNQDNASGRRFYQARGFEQIGRSATDDQGRPFPLLHLQRRSGPATDPAPQLALKP